jgi:hypothetical protein
MLQHFFKMLDDIFLHFLDSFQLFPEMLQHLSTFCEMLQHFLEMLYNIFSRKNSTFLVIFRQHFTTMLHLPTFLKKKSERSAATARGGVVAPGRRRSSSSRAPAMPRTDGSR